MTGLEPALLSEMESKDTATPLKQTFYILTKPTIARISAVVKWFLKNIQVFKRASNREGYFLSFHRS
jgi:hypothetical protein